MFFLFWSLRKQVKVHCHLSLLMGGENSAPFCGMCCLLSTALEGPWVGVHLSPCLAEKKAVRKVLAHSPCAIAQAEKCPHEGQARSSFLPLLFSPIAWWRAFGLAIPFGLPSPTLQSFPLTYTPFCNSCQTEQIWLILEEEMLTRWICYSCLFLLLSKLSRLPGNCTLYMISK